MNCVVSSFRTTCAAAGLLLAGLSASPALSAEQSQNAATTRPTDPHWSFSVSTYLWATGIDGKLGTLPPLPAIDVSLGFHEIIKNFDGGMMTSAEAQYGRYLIFSDMVATRLMPKQTFSARGYTAQVKLESTSVMGLLAGGYRLVDEPRYSIDGFAGGRGFVLSNTLRVQVAPTELSLSDSRQWLDGVVGARARVNLSDSLNASVIGFAGGGGSRYEWDVFAGLNYALSDRWSVMAGYRAMRVDYRNGPFVFDVLQQGPLLGVSARF
jgi:hypothetical protein